MAGPSGFRRRFLLRLDLGQHGLQAELVDAAQPGGRDAQAHPALLGFEPEAAVVQVGQEGADGLVVRVRDQMTFHRLLAGDIADTGHCRLQWWNTDVRKRRELYAKTGTSQQAWRPGDRRRGYAEIDSR